MLIDIELIQEKGDVKPELVEDNMVVKTKLDGMKMMSKSKSAFFNWEKIFIFPDSEKAQYFCENFRKGDMFDYRDGMLKDNYVFHIIVCEYPKPKKIYCDQLYMSKDYEPYKPHELFK